MDKQSLSNLLESEAFGEGKRHYFVDLRMAKNHRQYLQITRSNRVNSAKAPPKYQRVAVRVFEEDIWMLIEAISMVLGRYNAK